MGLKESKKYALGSVHENGGGKFEILDRWYEEETDTIMLKYKYIDDGRFETNKEVNVNASEWKWRKVRGLAGNPKDGHTTHYEEGVSQISNTDMEEYFEDIYVRTEKLITENRKGVQQLKEAFDEQHKLLIELMSVVTIQQKQIEGLVNDRNIINKLLEKI